MCYWLLTVSVKFFAWTTVQPVIHTKLFDTNMKGHIDKFDEELEKRLDNKNFVDDVEAD